VSHNEWRVEWQFGRAAFANTTLQRDWRDAYARADAHAFNRPEVLLAWFDTIAEAGGSTPVWIEAAHRNGAHVRLAAVGVQHHGRVMTRDSLEAAGQELFGYHDPLLVSGTVADWDSFWCALRDSAPAQFSQVMFRLVHPACAGRQFASARTEVSPVLTLSPFDSLDTVLAACPANHRGDVRRRLRRLTERGPLALDVFDAATTGAAVTEFEQQFWPLWSATTSAAGWAIARRAGLREFCLRVVRDGLTQGWGSFSVLRVNGESVAWHLGLADRGRLYWWLPLHREEWQSWSPGKVLLAKLIEWLVRARWRELHFQTGAQAYKLAWNPVVQPRATVRWHAPTFRGRVLAAYDGMMATSRHREE
jgi:CelD/BcsL family acetyltransferase involved in cellulose biosynthesis